MARVDLLVQDAFFASGLHVTVDTLTVAGLVARAVGQPLDASFAIRTRDGLPARSSSGTEVVAHGAWADADAADVVAFGIGMADDDAITADLAAPSGGVLVARLAQAHARGASVAASCSSTFYLAEAGLLDGGEAVTSWWLATTFRGRYPGVHLRPDAVVVEHGRVATAGAALAQIDLALHLVGRLGGVGLAHTVARYLVLDRAAGSVAPLLAGGHLARHDALVARAERLLRAKVGEATDLDAAARALGVSPRTLARRFRAATGLAPSAWLRRARVEEACRLLLATDRSIAEVAAAVGLGDDALRGAFAELVGESPRAWRQRRRAGGPLTEPTTRPPSRPAPGADR